MKFILTLFLLATTITINYSAPLTVQEVQLNNVAWLYAQFSLTFDGEELPLDSYFKNSKQLKLYELVQNFFSDNYLRESRY